MGTIKNDSMIKKTLKSLCCCNGWSYGVVWCFDQPNSLLLTLQNAYFEEQMGVVIDDMLLQVHMLGEGIIGQAAFTKKHRWIFSNVYCQGQYPLESIEGPDIFEDDSEFHHQFSSGIKTIAVISLEPWGVAQFGSTRKIMERTEFVDKTKRCFRDMEICEGLIVSECEPSSSNIKLYDVDGSLASLVSSRNSYSINHKYGNGASCQDLMGAACSLANLTHRYSSHLKNQLKIACTEAQVMLSSKSKTQLQHPLPQSTNYVKYSAAQTPTSSTWSGGDPSTTSFNRLPFEMRAPDSQSLFSAKPDNFSSFQDKIQLIQDGSTFTYVHGSGILVNEQQAAQCSAGDLMNYQNSAPLLHGSESELPETQTRRWTCDELFEALDVETRVSKSGSVENLSQWLTPSPVQRTETLTTSLNQEVPHAAGLISVTSTINVGENAINIPVNNPANSAKSCITNAFNSNGREKISNISVIENMFDSFRVDFGCGKGEEWDVILRPVVDGDPMDFNTENSECISEKCVGARVGPQKGYLSKIGLKQLFNGIGSCSLSGSSFEDQLSSTTKRRRVGSSFVSSDQVELTGLPCFNRNMRSLQPLYDFDKINNIGSKTESAPKSEAGSWMGDSYSMNAGSGFLQRKKHEQPGKAIKKKAKPGARPRPKDRQQIQDCISELRKLIPNGEKMSIDGLLDRTIKHLFFLRSVTTHVDRLKRTDEPKNGLFLKDYSSCSGNGITWACEVGDQTMVCPLIVEDLSNHGQMLIEMFCEKQGFFLEIVDIIQGFGLRILKGVMEVRETKIWEHFIVEAKENKLVTRHEVFSSLIQLLQLTAPSRVSAIDQLTNVVDCGTTLFNNHQQSVVPLPISMVDTLRCASL